MLLNQPARLSLATNFKLLWQSYLRFYFFHSLLSWLGTPTTICISFSCIESSHFIMVYYGIKTAFCNWNYIIFIFSLQVPLNWNTENHLVNNKQMTSRKMHLVCAVYEKVIFTISIIIDKKWIMSCVLKHHNMLLCNPQYHSQHRNTIL